MGYPDQSTLILLCFYRPPISGFLYHLVHLSAEACTKIKRFRISKFREVSAEIILQRPIKLGSVKRIAIAFFGDNLVLGPIAPNDPSSSLRFVKNTVSHAIAEARCNLFIIEG